jgi:hypothetical protein
VAVVVPVSITSKGMSVQAPTRCTHHAWYTSIPPHPTLTQAQAHYDQMVAAAVATPWTYFPALLNKGDRPVAACGPGQAPILPLGPPAYAVPGGMGPQHYVVGDGYPGVGGGGQGQVRGCVCARDRIEWWCGSCCLSMMAKVVGLVLCSTVDGGWRSGLGCVCEGGNCSPGEARSVYCPGQLKSADSLTYTSYRCGCCSRHRMGTTYYLQTPAPAPVPRTSRQSSQ